MEKFILGIGVTFVAAVMIFIAPIVGVLFGAFGGWIVSIMAPVWVPNGLAHIGINVKANDLVELGAALGFMSGFFRSRLTTEKKYK